VFVILIQTSPLPFISLLFPLLLQIKSQYLASVERDLDTLKAVQIDLKEACKQVNNLINQLIGDKRIAQGHQNQMEPNEPRQPMNVVSHAAKLGTIVQNKAELFGSEPTAESKPVHHVLHQYWWHARDVELRYAGAPYVYDEWNGGQENDEWNVGKQNDEWNEGQWWFQPLSGDGQSDVKQEDW
jgi:hypothetical protein